MLFLFCFFQLTLNIEVSSHYCLLQLAVRVGVVRTAGSLEQRLTLIC